MEERQKRKIKKVAKALTKASRSHAGQARTLKTLAKSSKRYYGKKKK
jgi:hypothetical protein|tara:strand:+ start:1839 stop:1979 length:141 start_codon:yes stop_codon:yes gene_type:complete